MKCAVFAGSYHHNFHRLPPLSGRAALLQAALQNLRRTVTLPLIFLLQNAHRIANVADRTQGTVRDRQGPNRSKAHSVESPSREHVGTTYQSRLEGTMARSVVRHSSALTWRMPSQIGDATQKPEPAQEYDEEEYFIP